MMQKQIYLILSDTGSLLTRCIKAYTKAPYNHVSIAFDDDLDVLYSFGRRYPMNPFWGGFVEESFYDGTFKRFKDTRCLVLSLEVDEDSFDRIKMNVDHFITNKQDYHYNFIGLIGLPFNVRITRTGGYYCSEFVAEVMQESEILDWDVPPFMVQPNDFMRISEARVVYEGLLAHYIKA